MSEVKFPEVKVQLSDSDGNVFAVLGKVMKAMKRAKIEQKEIDAFTAEATNGDYDHAIKTCMDYVSVH